MVKYLDTSGNLAFLRGAPFYEPGKHKDEWDAQESLAATLGPGVIEVENKTANGKGYGENVRERAEDTGKVFWHQTAYYRNDLGTSHWDKSLETIADLYNIEAEGSSSASPVRRRSSSSASSPVWAEPYDGALQAPSTILWGAQDRAVSKTICLDGINDYLARGSEVILLPQTHQWTPVEKESRAALTRIIGVYVASGSGKGLPTYVTKEVNAVYSVSTSLVKK